jgi:hypothetical protein
VGGAVFRYKFQDIEPGIDLIPNLGFWTAIPGLVKVLAPPFFFVFCYICKKLLLIAFVRMGACLHMRKSEDLAGGIRSCKVFLLVIYKFVVSNVY